MPKILITGNGFDLHYGLPTAYSDFIKILNHIHGGQIDFESIYSLTSNYSTLLNNFKPFEFNLDNIEILKRETSNNLWFDFFKNEFNIETWIDFENKIEYVLRILFTSVDYIKTHVFSHGSVIEDRVNYSSKLFNNNVEIIKVLDAFNIIEEDNFEVTLNKEFLVTKYGFFTDIDFDKISKHLSNELFGFRKIFNLYFEIFVTPLYISKETLKIKNIFYSIDKHYTFNFTPTFEKMLKTQNTSFLHGKIDSSLNQIVIGINEIPQTEIDKKYFIPFTKYFQKLNCNTDYNFIQEFDKKKNQNFMFFFWGHSLDKSDEDYINEVFDFVNDLNSRIKKIVVIYHNENSKSKLLLNLIDIRGKKDIVNLMRSEILLFFPIDSKELLHELNRNIIKNVSSNVY